MARDLSGQIDEILTTLNPEMADFDETRMHIRSCATSRFHAINLVRSANDAHTRQIERAKHQREMEVMDDRRKVEEERRIEATRMNEQLVGIVTTMQQQQEALLLTLQSNQDAQQKLMLTFQKRTRNVGR